MKKLKLITGLLSLSLCFTAAFSSLANAAQKSVKAVKATEEVKATETVKATENKDQDVDRIIVIAAHKSDKSKVTLNDYTKNKDGSWHKNWSVNGICGANGITDDKKEGDKKTPSGFFKATMNFGIKDDPGSKIEYHKIAKGDYWVDDSESKYYNKLVNTKDVQKDWKSAENMIAEAPFYNYGIALDYNSAAVPYKGSAIFIHCTNSNNSGTKLNSSTGSAGCIRIPEEYMIELIKSTDKNTRFYIMAEAETWYNSKYMK
mgnify:FL=1